MAGIGLILKDLSEEYRYADDIKTKLGIAKVLLSAGDTSLKVQVRVDEARLRRKEIDIMPEVKKLVDEQRAKLRAIEAQP